jgi:hypothetical protein
VLYQITAELANNPLWKKMAGSNFVNGLAVFVTQIAARYQLACENALMESRLTTATRPSSILAGAQDNGYIARKVSPSTGPGTLTNLTENYVGIPAGTAVMAQNGLTYTVTDAVSVGAGETALVPLAQRVLRQLMVTVNETTAYHEIILTADDTAQTHLVTVWVKEPDAPYFVQWQKTTMFRNTDEFSPAYTEFYLPTRQLGIRFGNGFYGKMPPVGSDIRLDVWSTDGPTTLMAGESLTFNDDRLNATCQLITHRAITGGQPAESIDDIRLAAMYQPQNDGELVWGEDYRHFLKNQFGGLAFLNVWGEQAQEIQDGQTNLLNNRTIFVSAYSDSIPSEALGIAMITKLNAAKGLNLRYRFVPPILTALSLVFWGGLPPTIAISDAQNQLTDAINARFGIGRQPVGTVTFDILIKDVWTLIDQLGLFSRFNVTIAGLDTPRTLAEYRYIALTTSTLTLRYSVQV